MKPTTTGKESMQLPIQSYGKFRSPHTSHDEPGEVIGESKGLKDNLKEVPINCVVGFFEVHLDCTLG